MEWPGIVSLVISGLLGSGGVVAFLSYRKDRDRGIREDDRADDESLNTRFSALMDSQVKYLVQPLQDKYAELDKKYELLSEKFDQLLDNYSLALDHINDLRRLWPESHLALRPEKPDRLNKTSS